jgi:hypothetical protein
MPFKRAGPPFVFFAPSFSPMGGFIVTFAPPGTMDRKAPVMTKRVTLGLAAGLFAAAVLPGMARDVPQDADLLLWCGSAFALMGGGAETDAEAQNFFIAREVLLEKAAPLLLEAQIPQDDLPGLVEIYDDRVIADFTSGDISYEGEACISAVGL